VPSFCRHGRLESNCSICSPREKTDVRPERPTLGGRRAPSGPKRGPARSSTKRMTVRRMERTEDDGYTSELVLGLRATQDAARLADEIAFSAARLRQLRSDPPGLYAEVARNADPEEATWLALLIAYLQPLEGSDPWAGIAAARVPWATGEAPDLDGVAVGPRGAQDISRAAEVLATYRAFVARAGSQVFALAGEPAWTPARRFDRAYERLAQRALPRAPRYEFLVTLGALGVIDMEPSSLLLGAEPTDPTVVAAKRILGIGDAINLQRRASDLANETGVPIAALDLALVNWTRPAGDRIHAGSTAVADDAERERIAEVLGATASDMQSPETGEPVEAEPH
jgi:hypothetical protein